METIAFDNDIEVMYVEAASYPEGIKDAHEKLHSIVPFSTRRKYFGISWPEKGTVIYKAAAEQISRGEAQDLKLKTMTVKKGKFAGVTLKEYMKNISLIGQTFQDLLTHPDLDPKGYCLEWYFNDKDVKCLVRLRNDAIT